MTDTQKWNNEELSLPEPRLEAGKGGDPRNGLRRSQNQCLERQMMARKVAPNTHNAVSNPVKYDLRAQPF